jgi:multidrug/hemolysin transport system ATP-binding protein
MGSVPCCFLITEVKHRLDHIIEVANLSKSYGPVKAVQNISFYAETGKLLAFLGPNGAGKSTTIDIICTFLRPDGGEVVVDGHVLGRDDDAIRRKIGVVFQDGLLDPLLSVRENLRLRGGFYGLKGQALGETVERTAAITGVTELLSRPYGKLSGGQRRRCDIARALLHTPKVLFLDEPTTGLDPQTRQNIWDTIVGLQRQSGMTVFMTTHYMEEAAKSDYVIVIDNGVITAKGTPMQLKEQYASDKLRLVPTQTEPVMQALGRLHTAFETKADCIEINLANTMQALPILKACEPYIKGFEVNLGTMDDAFIAITGKEMRA